MHLGDTLIQASLTPLVEEFRNSNPAAMIVLQEVSDISVLHLSGVVQLDKKGRVKLIFRCLPLYPLRYLPTRV